MAKLPSNIVLTPPLFMDYLLPQGWLERETACHALMYYALIAKRTYVQILEDHVYEGDEDPRANFREVFKSVATMYQVAPELMAKYWPAVRLQFVALGMGSIPMVIQNAQATSFMRGSNDPILPQSDMPQLEQIDFQRYLSKGTH